MRLKCANGREKPAKNASNPLCEPAGHIYSEVSRRLDLSRSHLYKLMQLHGLRD